MKRILTSALAAVVVAAGTGSGAQAQDMMMGRRASLFDLGVYAGAAYSSSWFSINGVNNPNNRGNDDNDGEGFRPGFAPIFGLTGTYWATPTIGIRAHGAYMPSSWPLANDRAGFFERDRLALNNYFYDLNLAFRPFILNETASPFMASTYFFLGGGGLTSNAAGDNPNGCIPSRLYTLNGVCVPTESDYGTVGQGNIGAGFDFMPLGTGMGIFGELAVHGYDSPAHVLNENLAEDRFAFTPRASLGVKFAFGNQFPAPAPIVVPPPVIETPPPPAPVDEIRTINVCVVQGGALREVQAQYNVTRGDTLVNGQPFSTAFPATTGYAAGATWYINSDVITVNGQRYVKFGLPRVLGVNDVTRMTDYQGVPVFAETGATGTPEIIYVPVRPGCEFQPYQREQVVRGVRG